MMKTETEIELGPARRVYVRRWSSRSWRPWAVVSAGRPVVRVRSRVGALRKAFTLIGGPSVPYVSGSNGHGEFYVERLGV